MHCIRRKIGKRKHTHEVDASCIINKEVLQASTSGGSVHSSSSLFFMLDMLLLLFQWGGKGCVAPPVPFFPLFAAPILAVTTTMSTLSVMIKTPLTTWLLRHYHALNCPPPSTGMHRVVMLLSHSIVTLTIVTLRSVYVRHSCRRSHNFAWVSITADARRRWRNSRHSKA